MLCFRSCCSYYGLSVWFPDQIKHLEYEEYKLKTMMFYKEKVEFFHFNFSLKNQIHKEGKFNEDRYGFISLFVYRTDYI